MIELELNKGQAIFLMEAVKQHARQITDQIANYLEDKITSFEMEQTAAENYVANLEHEVEQLTKLLAEQQTPKQKAAPWGYKKDGTPKKLPGRPRKEGKV
jgi:proline dehydrogenase